MTTITHEPATVDRQRRSWGETVLVREMWASLAITVMWLAVLFDALFGPNIEVRSATGDYVSIPTAGGVAVFAFFGTWVVARHGLRPKHDD